MVELIVINRTTVKGGAGIITSEYAQLVYKGEEIGFINEQGVFLKMYDSKITTGVFQNIEIFEGKTVGQKCQMFERHWEAIYDRYNIVSRGT